MIHIRGQQQQMQELARHHAVMEQQGQQKFEHEVYKDEEYLKLRRAMPRGKDEEYDAAMHGYRLAMDELDGWRKVLDNQFSYTPDKIKEAQDNISGAQARVAKARSFAYTILNRQLQDAQAHNAARGQ
jgi:hypothetical protein